MNIEVSKESKMVKIKKHFREKRGYYITGGICLTVGAIVGVVLHKKYGKSTQIAANIANVIEIKNSDDNTIVNNIFYQRVSKHGRVLGRHGNPVREIDPETGRTLQEFTKQLLAARDAGVSDTAMSRHLDGKYQDLNGRVFERINLEWILDPSYGEFRY